MKKILIILYSIIPQFLLSQTPPNVHFEGKLIPYDKEIKVIKFQKQGLRSHLTTDPDIEISLNSKGEFKADVFIASPSFYDLKDLWWGHTMLIQPGDTIKVTLQEIKKSDEEKNAAMFSYKMKTQSKKIGDILIFDEYIDKVGFATKINLQKDSPQTFKKRCEDNIIIGLSLLEKYDRIQKVSPLFKEWFPQYLNARYTLSMCEALYKISKNKIPANYFERLQTLNFNDPVVATICDQYMMAASVKNWYVFNDFDIKNPYGNLKSIFEGSRQNYTGIIKDRLMGWNLEDFVDKKSLDFEECYQVFLKECQNQIIKNSVIKKVKATQKNNAVKAGKVPTFKDFISKTQIENYAGKTFYLSEILSDSTITLLDFGASWCGPCKEQQPLVEDLEKLYKGMVQFVYLSTDTDEIKWRNSIKDKSQEKLKSQFVISGFTSSPINQYFDINLIPRYILISKKREIVLNAQLPLPSLSEDFENIIQKSIPLR
jgi:thiol-disulfide isomerase/thioredoxin